MTLGLGLVLGLWFGLTTFSAALLSAYQVSRWCIDCMIALVLANASSNPAHFKFFPFFVRFILNQSQELYFIFGA